MILLPAGCLAIASCSRTPELSLAEIAALAQGGDAELLQKTVSRPWNGGGYVDGAVGGVWNDTILSDPKTFNQLIAERDADSNGIISATLDYLVDYDATLREWRPHCAFYEIETDELAGTLTVHYTLREGLFWTYIDSDEKIPVTSDDIVFWYNEIAGDPQFGSSGYAQQFVTMPDGTERHIDCVKIDGRRFDFVFPRIVAEPLLSTNMSVCPSFLYRPAKERGGADGVKNLFSADCNPRSIPSCGKWYIAEYTPAQRLVFLRNPNYWEKDGNGVSIPYMEQRVFQIVGDMNTDFLLFRQGRTETYMPRPEEVRSVVDGQKDDYTVFNADGAMGASLWSFNQNPKNAAEPYYGWFTNRKFRQAMSCLLNRGRIISQTYRGLAEPKYTFFPEANPFYDADITLHYRYDPERALRLLESAGFVRRTDGLLYDGAGRRVSFDMTVPSANTVANDIAQIVADECSKVGITVNVRQLDFQKIIEMLTATYDWQSVVIGLGANLFPSQGSNVWPSSGNLHLWHPLQASPATEWEARIDYLYNEGCYTNDYDGAKAVWDEYQRILLEECPVIYLVRPRSFFAIRNKWDLQNVYYDNKNGAMTEHCFLRGL
ncbi:MAG: ABC transporter substrate-binding protein [Treponemataceae bacterium]|nr:ABC transporter substrate-binding protein [Treponemataceae bacterium]